MHGSGIASVEHLSIMLVDDDETIREALCELLGRKGWDVTPFNNAEAAIDRLKKEPERFNVLVSDINMPGLNGMDFLHRVKEAVSGLPVVMITGYPSIDIAVEAMKIGASDFLTKPFKIEELEITIRKVVSEAKLGVPAGPKRDERAFGNLPESARKRLEDKIRELSILHTINETIDEVNEKEDIFRKTMDIGQIITDTDKSFIMVIEQDSSELIVRSASGYRDAVLLGKRFSLKEEPFKSIVKNKCHTHFLVDKGCLAPLVGDGASRRGSLLLAPMFINKEVVVLLGLAGGDGEREVTNDAIALLLNLTAKASLKLENIALTENIFSGIIGAINSLINALDARDTYTKDHSTRVTQYALTIANALNCKHDVIDSISFAGPLHDIGKIGVRDDVLLKKGSFTRDEWDLVKTHVTRGEEILRPLNLLASEKAVVLYHHERWDGKGYPNGLEADSIPLVARIFSVADTYDAMTSTRPYRNALSLDVARDEIIKCSGSQFDPHVVEAFLDSAILRGQVHG